MIITVTVPTQLGVIHVAVIMDILSTETDTHVEVCAVIMMESLMLFFNIHCLADNDECSSNTTNNCSQICDNNLGSYTCDCDSGFILNVDGRSCIGDHY